MKYLGLALFLSLYAATVYYRVRLMLYVPKFCRNVKRCKRRHRVVFVLPPNKPPRAVLKHC